MHSSSLDYESSRRMNPTQQSHDILNQCEATNVHPNSLLYLILLHNCQAQLDTSLLRRSERATWGVGWWMILYVGVGEEERGHGENFFADLHIHI